MVNKICNDCEFAFIYKGIEYEKHCACQNSERYHLTNSKFIGKRMRDCKYKTKVKQ